MYLAINLERGVSLNLISSDQVSQNGDVVIEVTERNRVEGEWKEQSIELRLKEHELNLLLACLASFSKFEYQDNVRYIQEHKQEGLRDDKGKFI